MDLRLVDDLGNAYLIKFIGGVSYIQRKQVNSASEDQLSSAEETIAALAKYIVNQSTAQKPEG